MATITAKDVAALRAKTGLGMMDCKKALVESEGDIEKAIKILREKGLATAAKKESRIAAEGIVDIMTIDNVTAMVEVNSETDFVAKNDKFKDFVKGLLRTIIANKPADLETLLVTNYDGTETLVKDSLVEKIAMIGEKLDIRRFVIVEGITSTYIHGLGSIGVIVSFDADEAAVNHPGFAEFAKNIALQVGAYPVAYLNKESVPASVVEEEKSILMAQIANDPKNASKPAQIIEKMVVGRIGKFYDNNCLLEQAYVKEDSIKVSKYVENCAKEFGGNITVTGYYRFEKGEGIQKREENFAEEIAKLTNK